MIAVIGAGPAGCAAAIMLARAGRRVLLLERQAAARESVCGEFLGADAAAALAALGLRPGGAGRRAAAPAPGSAGAGGRPASPCPSPPGACRGRVLDGALREAAVAAGAELRAGVAVQGAEPGPAMAGRCACRTRRSPRGRWCWPPASTPSAAIRAQGAPAGALGLKLHLAGVDAGDAVTLLPFAGGYAGLQPLPGGGANLCAALHGEAGAAARDAAGFVARVAAGSALGARLLDGARPALGPAAGGGRRALRLPRGRRAARPACSASATRRR